MRPAVFFCLLLPLVLCAAAKERNWKVGRITADSSISGDEYLKGSPSHNRAVDPHVLRIQSGESLYTAREKHAWNGWCLLIQGEQIKYAVDNHRLFIVDGHGDTCQLEILSEQKSAAH